MKRFIYISWIIPLLFAACTSQPMKKPYYRYSIGLGILTIDNPVYVWYSGRGSDSNVYSYVCPDSALCHCTEPNWEEREDVYPFVCFGELRNELYSEENERLATDEYASTFYTSPLHKLFIWPHFAYEITDESTFQSIEHEGYEICYEKFYYGLNKFDCFLQSVDGRWYDPSDPEGINADADQFNALSFSPKYRIAVKDHYTFLQMIKLSKIYKKRMQEAEEYKPEQ